ncbi:hypothetical protein [Comamonas sp. 23]|uniref:hypothetical protein n=1 Tax=Comamonas sp. 23 TaxID=3415008 RepID=UPI003C6ECA3C
MHPVPRLAQQLVTEWAEDLAPVLGRSVEEIQQKGLGAADFPSNGSLHIKLMDGSFVQFEHAFHVVNAQKFAIAVFTEHCGYHVFPFHEAEVSRIQREVLFVQAF